ncbi:MAG TPA: pitrilysin family protein [Blastocatellia bacterium]|nr:pitrilysin family protein [Blastocatellia bacterium]
MRRLIAISLLAGLLLPVSLQAAPQSGSLSLPPFKRVKLGNGLTLLLSEQHEVPIVSFNFIVRAGSVDDPAGKEGVASLTAALLRKGTSQRTADQISSELDFIGGDLDAVAQFDYSVGSAEFVKKDLAKGLDLLSDVLLHAIFPDAEVTKILKQRADEIRSAKDRAPAVIGSYFASYLYGSHPYARPVGGDERSIAGINRADIAAFYQARYKPDEMIIAAVGDFSSGEMERILSDKFGSWQGHGAAQSQIARAVPFTGKKLLLVDKPDATQTYYQIGNVGIARDCPDRVYIGVVNTLFGGRFTSMLNSELRIQTGLTYGASSFFQQRKAPGPFVISTYTRNEKTEEAINRTLDILKRLHEKGITDEELKSAKAYLKGQFPPTIETSDQLAGLLTQLEFFGLDAGEVNSYYAKVDSMTLDDARRIIKQYFPADNLVFVLIGKASEIEPVAKKYAPVFDRLSISQPGFGLQKN